MASAFREPPETVDPVEDRQEALESPEAFARYGFGYLGPPERVAMRSAFADQALLRGESERAMEIAQYFAGVPRIEFLCRAAGYFLEIGERERAEELVLEAQEIAIGMEDWGQRQISFLLSRRLADIGRAQEVAEWSWAVDGRWREPMVMSRVNGIFPDSTKPRLRRQALSLAQAADVNERPRALAEVAALFIEAGEEERAFLIVERARSALEEMDNPFLFAPAAVEVGRVLSRLGRSDAMHETILWALNGIATQLGGWQQTDSWLLLGHELARDPLFEKAADSYWGATNVLIRRLARVEGMNKFRLYELAMVAALQLREGEFPPERRREAAALLEILDAMPDPVDPED